MSTVFELPAGFEFVLEPALPSKQPELREFGMAIIKDSEGNLFAYNPLLKVKFGTEMYPVDEDFDFDLITVARYYQYQAVQELKKNLLGYDNHAGVFKKYLRNLLVLPTGAGKTLASLLVFSDPEIREILTGSRTQVVKVLFVAHRNRLLTQAVETYARSKWVEIHTQMAKTNYDKTFIDLGWDITIIDEAHHEAMKSIQVQLEHLVNKPILLLTATPIRKDGMLIKADKEIRTLTREDAEAYGFLARAGVYSVVDYDLVSKTDLVKDILSEFGEDMGQTIIFTQYRKDVEQIVAHLSLMGLSAVGIGSNTQKADEEAVLSAFSSKDIQFIVNCTKLDEGVDVSGVETVLIGRNYGSYNQINQVVGRVVRPDCPATVWQLVNPFRENLDATSILHRPMFHRVYEYVNGDWEYDDLKVS